MTWRSHRGSSSKMTLAFNRPEARGADRKSRADDRPISRRLACVLAHELVRLQQGSPQTSQRSEAAWPPGNSVP